MRVWHVRGVRNALLSGLIPHEKGTHSCPLQILQPAHPAARLLDGSGAPPVDDGLVVVEGKRIAWAGPVAAAPESYRQVVEGAGALPGSQLVSYPNGTMLPGLIDTHTHFSLPADGRPYEPVMAEPDGLHLLYGVRNARLHLEGGVTTARDLGARRRVAFDLRAGQQLGLFPAPRLLVAGRSIAALAVTSGFAVRKRMARTPCVARCAAWYTRAPMSSR